MSIAFNGTSSRIAFPSEFFNYERTQPWSISCMLYFSGAKSGSIAGYSIFSRLQTGGSNSGIEFGLIWTALALSPNNSLVPYAYISNVFSSNRINVSGSVDIAASAWTHCAVTYDGGSLAAGVKLYVNSTLNTNTVTGNNLSATTLVTVTPSMGSRGATNSWMNGQIQNFGAWDAELNADEITSLSKGFSPRSVRPQSLITAAPLIREIIDIRGNALTGTNTSVGANNPRIYA